MRDFLQSLSVLYCLYVLYSEIGSIEHNLSFMFLLHLVGFSPVDVNYLTPEQYNVEVLETDEYNDL